VLAPNGQQRDDNPHAARGQRDKVGVPVAAHAIGAVPLAVGPNHAVAVKDEAVEEVEDVARDDGAQRHEAPVLAQAVDAKGLGHDGGEDAKQKTVAEARQARDEAQEVRVRDVDGAELGDAEDGAGDDEAPGAAGV